MHTVNNLFAMCLCFAVRRICGTRQRPPLSCARYMAHDKHGISRSETKRSAGRNKDITKKMEEIGRTKIRVRDIPESHRWTIAFPKRKDGLKEEFLKFIHLRKEEELLLVSYWEKKIINFLSMIIFLGPFVHNKRSSAPRGTIYVYVQVVEN